LTHSILQYNLYTTWYQSIIISHSLHYALPILFKIPITFNLSIYNNLYLIKLNSHIITCLFSLACQSALYSKKVKKPRPNGRGFRSEEHTSEIQSRFDLVCHHLHDKKHHINYQ